MLDYHLKEDIWRSNSSANFGATKFDYTNLEINVVRSKIDWP